MRVATLISSLMVMAPFIQKEDHPVVVTVGVDITQTAAGRELATQLGSPGLMRQLPHLRIVGINPTLQVAQVRPLNLRLLVDNRLPPQALAQRTG